MTAKMLNRWVFSFHITSVITSSLKSDHSTTVHSSCKKLLSVSQAGSHLNRVEFRSDTASLQTSQDSILMQKWSCRWAVTHHAVWHGPGSSVKMTLTRVVTERLAEDVSGFVPPGENHLICVSQHYKRTLITRSRCSDSLCACVCVWQMKVPVNVSARCVHWVLTHLQCERLNTLITESSPAQLQFN